MENFGSSPFFYAPGLTARFAPTLAPPKTDELAFARDYPARRALRAPRKRTTGNKHVPLLLSYYYHQLADGPTM